MKYSESIRYYSHSDDDQDLWLLLTHARYAIFRAREKELQKYGISPEQAGVLFVVQAMGNKATPAEISRLMLRQPHTISAIVERMSKKGLIQKTKDLERKNLIRVALTEKGEKAYKITTKRGPIHRIMSNLTDKERKYLHTSLAKLLDIACKEIGIEDKKPVSFFD